ncbi:MAG: SctD/MshK family protein [Geminicoccaceae bacterium]
MIIESGLHAGVVQRFAPGMYTIGSELESDVVLSDPDVASLHVVMELDYRGLRLEPLKGPVSVDGETAPLDPGAERNLPLPATFRIGKARISIKAPHDAVRSKTRLRLAALATSTAVLGMVGLFTFGPMAGSVDSVEKPVHREDVAQSPTAPDPTTAMAADQTSDPSTIDEADRAVADAALHDVAFDEVTLDDVAGDLRKRLASAALDDIDLVLAGDRLVARGTADPDMMGEWQSVQMWFDTEHAGQFLLVSEVAPAEKQEPPQLAIEAVWLGDTPYLLAGGHRFHQGAAIGEGWVVEHIGADEIKLKRGDQLFSLTL